MAARRRSFHRLEDALAADPADVRELFITGAPRVGVPPAVFAMTGLERLVISDQGLTELPAELGQLTKLKALSLRDNQLRALPPEIGLLKRLNDINLAGNPATMVLPPEFFTLRANIVTYPNGLVPEVPALVEAIAGPVTASGGVAPAVYIHERFGVAPAADVAAFAWATRGMGRLPGPFAISGFDAVAGTRRTFAELWRFDEYGDTPIPAVLLGGDGRGTELWLNLGDGAVIAVHHDELFEFAAETRAMLQRVGRDRPGELMRELAYWGSLVDIRALLYLQRGLPRIGITDWVAFMRKSTKEQRAAVFRLICIGQRMSPGHLRGAKKWRARQSRFVRPVLSA